MLIVRVGRLFGFLPFCFVVVQSATTEKGMCDGCKDLAASFEKAAERELAKPQYRRYLLLDTQHVGPIPRSLAYTSFLFFSLCSENLFYQIIEDVCSDSYHKTEV